MHVEDFLEAINSDYFVGVPDSQLRALCDALMDSYGIDPAHHVIAANEGNAVAMAAGYRLATGKIPVVYMQNSGEGNAVNPVASLTSPDVYGISMLFVIGWRGEPGVRDEPQHVLQGKVTLDLLDLLGIESMVISEETSLLKVKSFLSSIEAGYSEGRSGAFVVRKGALSYGGKRKYANEAFLLREDVVRMIVEAAVDSPIVCTTGKASRELFEIREAAGQGHCRDFLTVGSMGHASSIALGIASQMPNRTVWCVDGDGAALMHMGSMAVIGACAPKNFVHIVLNNSAHETVGGMPTVASSTALCAVADACGYSSSLTCSTAVELKEVLSKALYKKGPTFIEVKCALGSRADLGRPTTTPKQNREAFELFLRK